MLENNVIDKQFYEKLLWIGHFLVGLNNSQKFYLRPQGRNLLGVQSF